MQKYKAQNCHFLTKKNKFQKVVKDKSGKIVHFRKILELKFYLKKIINLFKKNY